MVTKDNTLKKEAPVKETTPSEKVEKTVDIRKDLTMEEAERLVAQEEGETPEVPLIQAIKKEKIVEEPKVELPERYKGKSAEELVKLLDEKEKFIQGRSDEIGEYRQKIKETEELREKVVKIEEEAIKESQQPSNLPQKPQPPIISDSEYYEDPVKAFNKQSKYNKELLDYVDQLTSAKTAPFYQSDVEKRREKLYIEMENKYIDFPVKFDREKVQGFLNQNPQYFTKYKTNAYEQAYHDMSATDFSQQQKVERETMREQVKREVLEEMKNQSQASNVGLSDLETQSINPTGSAPKYDIEKMEEDPEYNRQVIADMEKRRR